MKKWMIILVVVGLLASLIQITYRLQSEVTNKQVEIAFDYRDLVDIATMKSNQQKYMEDQLRLLRTQNVTTICVSESSLQELEQLQRIEFLSAKELSMLTRDITYDPGYSYVIFKNLDQIDILREQIKAGFARVNVAVTDWEFEGKAGLRIAMPQNFAQVISLYPDEISIQKLRKFGFSILLRMSNLVEYNNDFTAKLLEKAAKHGVRWVVFDGIAVPGYEQDEVEREENLRNMAELLKQNGIGIAVVELMKLELRGIRQLAEYVDYDMVRMHSISEIDATLDPDVISDRLALAIKDRNIRIVFLNASMKYIQYKNKLIDTIAEGNLNIALTDEEEGLIQKLDRAGFTLKQAEPFNLNKSPLNLILMLMIIVGCFMLTVLLLSVFFPNQLKWLMIGSALFFAFSMVLSFSFMVKLLGLAAAVSAPSLAVILTIKKIKDGTPNVLRAIQLFAFACLGSVIGGIFVSGILYDISFMLVLNHFFGVSLLHLLPIMIVGIYLVFFQKKQSALERYEAARRILTQPVYLYWVVIAACGGVLVLYYLSRTGNAGQTIELEITVRKFLETTLGVRPRIKEFLFAHPLFIFAAYISFKYKYGLYLFVFAVMGQLSIVSSYTHLHTPIIVSTLRVVYGMIGGILVGLLLIFMWQLARKGWQLWLRSIKG